MFEQIKMWLQTRTTDEGASTELVPFGRGKFGADFEMGHFLGSLNEKELFDRVVCKLCGDLPRSPQIEPLHYIEYKQYNGERGDDVCGGNSDQDHLVKIVVDI